MGTSDLLAGALEQEIRKTLRIGAEKQLRIWLLIVTKNTLTLLKEKS